MTVTAVWTTIKPERRSLKWQTEKQMRPTASKFLFSFSFYGRLTGSWSYKKLGEGQTCFSAVGGERLPTVPSQAERSGAAAHSMFPAAGTRLGKTRETRRNEAVDSTWLLSHGCNQSEHLVNPKPSSRQCEGPTSQVGSKSPDNLNLWLIWI